MENKRSLVRVKTWLLETIFIVCGVVIQYGSLTEEHKIVLFMVACFMPMMLFFVRCEQCETFEFWKGPDMWPFIPTLSWKDLFYPPKRCPVCGMERY